MVKLRRNCNSQRLDQQARLISAAEVLSGHKLTQKNKASEINNEVDSPEVSSLKSDHLDCVWVIVAS